MASRKVRAGQRYQYCPVGLDCYDSRTQPNVKAGDVVQVVKLPGCPPPNTMGMCHINGPDGRFGGLVLTNSLQPLNAG